MDVPDIINEHIRRNAPGTDPEAFMRDLGRILNAPGTKILREGDCLFIIKSEEGQKSAFMRIINGGSAAGYLRAIMAFFDLMRKMGYERVKMRVADTAQSRKIAAAAGVTDVQYKEVGGADDPYVMTMEL